MSLISSVSSASTQQRLQHQHKSLSEKTTTQETQKRDSFILVYKNQLLTSLLHTNTHHIRHNGEKAI